MDYEAVIGLNTHVQLKTNSGFRRHSLLALPLMIALSGLSRPACAAPGDEHWDYRFGPPGADDTVYVVAATGGELYVGGLFGSVGGTAANHIAQFDGVRWSPLGSGLSDLQALAVVAQGSNVYVGGSFNAAGGVSATNIACWNGTQWSALGAGINGQVWSLAVAGNELYAGGIFTMAGGVAANNIARWDGTNWSALGSGVTAPTNVIVKALATDGTNLYVGGSFTNAGGLIVTNIAVWDGGNWSAFSGGGIGETGGGVLDMLFNGTDLYVGGAFNTVGEMSAASVARWDGSNWFALGSGVSGTGGLVYGLAEYQGDIYACGQFTNAGGISANGIARWNGASWTNLGNGISGSAQPVLVIDMAVGPDGRLYCGGLFDMAGTLAVGNLAAWDGSEWKSAAEGLDQGTYGPLTGQLRALAANGTSIYAGGIFHSVGGVKASRIARWDGTNWSALGSGVKGINDSIGTLISAIAVNDGDVYAGGAFTNAGGITASNIAKWNGTAWSALGTGCNSNVAAIAISGSNLYAGGSFTSAGGVSASRIAKWDGGSWSALGTGVNGSVTTILVASDGVYVGGSFTIAGGTNANRVAKWDGSSWSPLGSDPTNGLNNTVNALVEIAPSTIGVGGAFTTAGGMAANRIAQWDGLNWSTLGSGFSGGSSPAVNALAFDGTHLYAAGSFTNASGTNANGIAAWDGMAWSALGGGLLRRTISGPLLPAAPVALAVGGADLYVGGLISVAGGKASANVARWNEQMTFTPPAVMRMDRPLWSAQAGFQLRVTASIGTTYTIEATTNFSAWVPLLTNGASPLNFAESAATIFSGRFYRVRQWP